MKINSFNFDLPFKLRIRVLHRPADHSPYSYVIPLKRKPFHQPALRGNEVLWKFYGDYFSLFILSGIPATCSIAASLSVPSGDVSTIFEHFFLFLPCACCRRRRREERIYYIYLFCFFLIKQSLYIKNKKV